MKAATRPNPLALGALLLRASAILTDRLSQLEERLERGDEATWPAYLETARTLVTVAAHVATGRRGESS